MNYQICFHSDTVRLLVPEQFTESESKDMNNWTKIRSSFANMQRLMNTFSQLYSNVKIDMILSGYDDPDNFMFKSASSVIINGLSINIIGCSTHGILNIITKEDVITNKRGIQR